MGIFRFLITAACCMLFVLSVAAKKKTEELKPFTGVYWIEHFSSQRDAERQAEQLAIEDALSEKYGVAMYHKVITKMDNMGKNSFIDTDVSLPKGQLVKVLNSSFECAFEQNKLRVTATVHILAREREEKVGIDARFLRHKDDTNESLNFYDNDDLYMSFQTPVDGYLAVYLEDENNRVYNLLPYASSPEGSIMVEHGKKYLFFCDDKSFFARNKQYRQPESYKDVQPLFLQAPKTEISNCLYVAFSPNKFSRPNANYSNGLPELNPDSFQKWLGTQRAIDDDFVDDFKVVVISPRK